MGSPTLLCILGGQLLINLKEAGERGANGGTNYTVSGIEFGEVSSQDLILDVLRQLMTSLRTMRAVLTFREM